MGIRLSGLSSGMDTESIVTQLMDAHRMKNKRTTDKQTLLTWKQDKLKELNAKIFKLYTDDISKMRMQGNYLAKKITSSNENLVSVTGSTTAPEGAHNITIESLASGKYETGAQITKDKDGNLITPTLSTKLSDLGINVETLINFTSGATNKTLEVTDSTTLGDLVNKAKEAGLNANFDTNQKRLFISSKQSGLDNSFQITATTSTATAPKNEILDAIDYSMLSSTDKEIADKAIAVLGNTTSTPEDIDTAKQALVDLTRTKELKKIESDMNATIRGEVTPIAKGEEETAIRAEVMQEQIVLIQEEARQAGVLTEEEITAITEDTLTPEQEANILVLQDEKVASSTTRINAAVERKVKEAIETEKALEPTNRYTDAAIAGEPVILAAISSAQTKVDEFITKSKDTLGDASTQLNILGLGTLSTTVDAADSKITYNNVVLTGSSNVITANGLTMTLKGISAGETISLNVTNNTQETYDMVKNFVKNYNTILKEMNTLFNAPSSKGYAPLSDEERESMTDNQIEKWESKIQDSILKRDSTLGSLTNVMRTSLMNGVVVDGKNYSLASYGIQTSVDYKEQGLLHIYGDKDDAGYSSYEDKLMKAIEEDPDTVMKVLSGVATNLYKGMGDKMSAIPNMRSAFTFYNDKEMDKVQTQYKKQISVLESRLTDMENRYYKQFSAMEVAMAKMQSQSNALAGMLGTNNNQ